MSLRANPGGMAQQHTGPQLQLICILVVLHGSCHTGHLRPSLAALALAEGAAAVRVPAERWSGVPKTERMHRASR